MIEVKRDDFFVESIKNPIEYGTYYKINPKYGTGFQWTSEVHHDFIITVTDIRFNQETMKVLINLNEVSFGGANDRS